MGKARVQILIPTFNNTNEIDATIQSIMSQEFDLEDVYTIIMDFGSTDGTYEKILGYQMWNLGIYQKPYQKNERQRLADIERIWDISRAGNSFLVVLYPGDIMYPNCLKVLAERYCKDYSLDVAAVFCESDIRQEDGSIVHQKPLFEKDCIIDGNSELKLFIQKDRYRHQIFQTKLRSEGKRNKAQYEEDESRCLSKLARISMGKRVLYIKEALVCTKRIEYKDELQEILYRWESIVCMIRAYESKFACEFDGDFARLANENLAEYALWRSFAQYQKKKKSKDIEDCFLIAGVIADSIKETKIYKDMYELIINKCEEKEHEIESYYSESDSGLN